MTNLFCEALTRRLAAHSPLRDIEFEFAPDRTTDQRKRRSGTTRRYPDQLDRRNGRYWREAHQNCHRVSSGHVDIRLSSRERMDPAAFGKRRLDLYNRTLGWLGGGFECRQPDGNAEFLIRLAALQAV